ncbi:unnamed protein product [Schistocephalus solidus]|uniref:Retrovirus-related Pol polyprotein from transposon TNT 1-94 n=1 Tax=Schistocephalus solidus TaxID=70667 RepID=A0A183SP28_SCHSO|nr:unnamed protein product [Schistocephalus solidus]
MPDKLTVYDDYDLWEDRMKVYLEAVYEGARPAAILGRLDNEVNTVARGCQSYSVAHPHDNLQASAARVRTVVDALGCPCRPQKFPTTRGLVCRRLPATSSCPGPSSLPKRVLHRARNQDFGELRRRDLSPRDQAPIPTTLQSISSPWDSDRAATSAHKRLNGSGALLSPLLLGVAFHNPKLLGEALHSLIDTGTGGNNVVVRPALHLS